MLRTAVIGLGWWGKEVIKRLANSDRIQIVAGVDIAADTVKDFLEDYNILLLNRYEDVLENLDIDAVILTTPNGLHEAQVLAAAAAGKQIFCEKPLTLSSAGAKRMLAACNEKGIQIGIGYERRYEGAMEETKRMLEDGELGTLLHMEFNASYNLFAGVTLKGWRHDPKQAPAGTMTALGVHHTDFMQSIAGPAKEVYSCAADRSPDYPGNDIVSILIKYESGVTGSFCTIGTTPFYQRMTVFGDRGWSEIREVSNVDKPDPAVLTWRGMDEEIHTRTYSPTDTVTQNFHAWADAVAGKSAYRFSRQEILHNVEILEAIVISAETGKPYLIGS